MPESPRSEQGDSAPAEPTVFESLGGEPAVQDIVDRFYDLMELEPQFSGIRDLHPATLAGSRQKLFWYLCGWFGGPSHYIERFGHPRLRARHLPFAIGENERDQWLTCMAQALHDQGVRDPLFTRLLEAFYGTADWMRNQAG